MSTDSTAFAAILEPWWRVFPPRHLAIHYESDEFDLRVRLDGLRLPLSDYNSAEETTWRGYCEAIEILLLASRVNPLAFREIVWNECRNDDEIPIERFEVDTSSPCRLHIELDFGTSDSNQLTSHLSALAILLSPPTERSAAYIATRAALLDLAREQHVSLEDVVIPVVVCLSFEDEHNASQSLNLLVELQRLRLRETTHAPPFAVECVDVGVTKWLVSTDLMDAIDRFKATPGLQLRRLMHRDFDSDHLPSSLSKRKNLLLRLVSATTGLGSDLTALPDDMADVPSDQWSQLQQVACREPSDELFTAFCSSLMFTHHLRGLNIDLDSQDSNEFRWCWLMYALFNEFSRHSVTALKITAADIQLDDLLQVRKLLRSPRPLEMLLSPEVTEYSEEDSSSQTCPVQVVLREGALIHHELPRSEDPLVVSSGMKTFDVMRELDNAYGILTPGYGQCWVAKEDVAVEIPLSEENSRNRWRLKTHSITKLSVSLSRLRLDDEDRGLRVLLKLMGTPLTHLSLNGSYGGALSQSYLDLAWTSCPNLVHFGANNIHLDSFEDIVEAYSSGRCRVSNLSLENCDVRDFLSVVNLVNALADASSPIAKNLCQLCL